MGKNIQSTGYICFQKIAPDKIQGMLDRDLSDLFDTLACPDDDFFERLFEELSPFDEVQVEDSEDGKAVYAYLHICVDTQTKDMKDQQLLAFLSTMLPITIGGNILIENDSPWGSNYKLYFDADLNEWLPCNPDPATFACDDPICYEQRCAYYAGGRCRAGRVSEELAAQNVDDAGRVKSCDSKILKL